MREEDLSQVDQADARPEQLPLRSLSAIEEQALSATAQEQGRRSALSGRHRARSAEKDEIDVHRVS
jgi:hypothetical protein